MHVLFLTITGRKAMDSHTASSKLQTLANTHTEPPFQLPASLANIVTSLILKTWEAELASHPKPQFLDFILQGIQKGFRIGFEARNIQIKSCTANMKSAQDHPIVVQDYLAHEEAAGRIGSLAAYSHLAEKCHITLVLLVLFPKRPNLANGDLS